MIVVDASVWLSFLLEQDVNHSVTQPWFIDVLVSKLPIAAPILLLAEVGGAVSRRLGDAEMGEKAINRLLSIPTLRLVDVDHALGIQTGRIAANYRLRGADACYVAVAAQLNVPLVSWDQEQLDRVAGLIAAYTPAMER
jgi:predicted nucleic acid-binding protein